MAYMDTPHKLGYEIHGETHEGSTILECDYMWDDGKNNTKCDEYDIGKLKRLNSLLKSHKNIEIEIKVNCLSNNESKDVNEIAKKRAFNIISCLKNTVFHSRRIVYRPWEGVNISRNYIEFRLKKT